MKRIYCAFFLFLFCSTFSAQKISEKLDKEVRELLSSPEMYAANLSFYVSDEQDNFIYEYNGNKGLSTASTQKIFTAAAALDILGENFRYKTKVSHSGKINDGNLEGDLFLMSEGDPTLGSWRYSGYKPEDFRMKFIQAIKDAGIKKISGDLIIDDSYFDFQNIPGGWPWNDIGNYYGAGTWGVNWRENQFDMNIQGGSSLGSPTRIMNFSHQLQGVKWVNGTHSAGRNSGDKSIIYTAPHSEVAYINGTLPMGKTSTVSGSVPNPPKQLAAEIKQWFQESGIEFNGNTLTASQELIEKGEYTPRKGNIILEYESPEMRQIIYWFMKKSVNLYGETLLKTIGKVKNGNASYSSGIKALQGFWKEKGIRTAMINFADGSGLSPQNYASARAEVQALIWAKKQEWFPAFEESFPSYNGMKIKSGTIKDAKAYAGYHTAKTGERYVFAVIVNNYHGKNVNEKLFKLLNILK